MATPIPTPTELMNILDTQEQLDFDATVEQITGALRKQFTGYNAKVGVAGKAVHDRVAIKVCDEFKAHGWNCSYKQVSEQHEGTWTDYTLSPA